MYFLLLKSDIKIKRKEKMARVINSSDGSDS